MQARISESGQIAEQSVPVLSVPARSTLFDPFKAHDALIAEINKLQIMRCGLIAKPYELENNAGYIEQLCKLVANHIEEIMADAGASLPGGNIDETLAHSLSDVGGDCARAMNNAAWELESA